MVVSIAMVSLWQGEDGVGRYRCILVTALIFVFWHNIFECEVNTQGELYVHPVGLPRQRC